MAGSISSTTLTISPSPSSTIPPSTPTAIPMTTVHPTVTKTFITSTIQLITTTESGSLLRDGVGTAINAVYIAMFILLGLCVLLCIISSACWCFMKNRRDNRFNNFMNQPLEQTASRRNDREEEP